MVKKRLIPCLDVTRGRVVKGVNFVDLRDIGDPVELATRYSELGADELVFLDITATVEGREPLLRLIEHASEELEIPFTVGGGISTIEHARAILRAGADKVSVNRAALDEPGLIEALSYEFGAQAVVCAIDAKRRDSRDGSEDEGSDGSGAHPGRGAWFEVVTHGGRTPRGIDAIEWAQEAVRRGAGEILLTSIDADGTRAGYDLELTRAVADAVIVPVIASGGAGQMSHLADAFAAGAEAALVASIVHEAPERIPVLKRELKEAGWPMRI
jgi:cyclase